jgi:CDP-paratose 2-epimerase
MKVVIIGGAGFIGSNAASYYLQRNAEVTIFDNLQRKGTASNLSWIKQQGKKLDFIKGDIRNPKQLSKLSNVIKRADLILHLAAQVAVTTSVIDPYEDFMINAYGTFNVLELLRRNQAQGKLIYTSTNKVYGGLEHRKVIEKESRYELLDLPHGVDENEPLDFHSPYGCSKGAADQYVRDYSRMFNLDTVVFRQSCIYGKWRFRQLPRRRTYRRA